MGDPHRYDEQPDSPVSRHVEQDTGVQPGPARGAKPRCFDVASLDSEDDPKGINIPLHDPSAPVTPEMRSLLLDILALERTILVLFADQKYKEQRRECFDGLLKTAKVGLCGTDYDVEMGRLDLALTKDDITNDFPKLRNELWKTYVTIAARFSLLFGGLGCLLYYELFVAHAFSDRYKALLDAAPMLPQIVIALVWIPFGVPIGIFLEFVFRVGDNITYDRLLTFNSGRWEPPSRTINTWVTAYVFAFLLGIGAVQIGIGSVLLNDFITGRPWLSVAIGFVTGFAYPYVQDIVTQLKPERRDAAPRDGSG